MPAPLNAACSDSSQDNQKQYTAPWAVSHCDSQGYRGRIAIMEILKLDNDLDEMIAHRVTARELQKAAIAKDFRTLADDGVRRVLDGSSALDELMRIVNLTDRM